MQNQSVSLKTHNRLVKKFCYTAEKTSTNEIHIMLQQCMLKLEYPSIADSVPQNWQHGYTHPTIYRKQKGKTKREQREGK